MKILWISYFGSWTIPLFDRIKQGNTVGIIVPGYHTHTSNYQRDGITFYEVAFKKGICHKTMTPAVFNQYYKKIIEQFQPDLIHVHGTEKNLAQIQKFIPDIPVVISIQGLLTGYKNYAYNYLTPSGLGRFTTLKNLLGRGGIRMMYKVFCNGYSYETDILNNGKYFIGRTDWDKAHVLLHNPRAQYFHGEELLRKEFYRQAASWNIQRCVRRSIFMTASINPIKGMHLAIEAIHLLKQYYPDIHLSVPGIGNVKRLSNRLWGEEYVLYCLHLIRKYNLEDNINLLPRLSEEEMVEELQKANVFLSPTSIDNSPNAVGEASMIGTPIVVTPVGGIPSIFQDEKEVLFAPAGDPYMMAYQIKRILDDDELAMMLSRNVHQKALMRHDREKTTSQYLNCYRKIIQLHHKL